MKIAILGTGVMGSAFARQLAKKGHHLLLCDHHEEKAKELAEEIGGEFIQDPKSAATEAELVFLAIKPKDLDTLAKELGDLKGKILFSILAGISVSDLKKRFAHMEIVRSMPNLALIHGEAVIGLVDHPELKEATKTTLFALLQEMGLVFWTQEDQIDAITALAGSGPAFIIAIVEAMVDAGIMMGLKAGDAKKLVLQTILGAVALMKDQVGHPGDVRWQISAPKGTTIAGLHTFEEEGVRAGMMNTLLAAFEKAKEILK